MSYMEITTKVGCKNNCIYCPQDKFIAAYTKRSNILQMDFNTFKICIDKIPLDVDIIFSGMCEPWSNTECTKMLLYTHKKGHKIAVFTTLVGMNLLDIDLIEQIPFMDFIVHLPSNEGYEKIKIDEKYLKVLERISKSSIKILYFYYGKDIDSRLKSLVGKNAVKGSLITIAGNIKIKNKPSPKRKKGIIGCENNLHRNILLPNGDVILCCLDYAMKHILGNLLSDSYDSLFRSKEFLRIKKGLENESLDILCRYCDMRTQNISLFAKIYNPIVYRYIHYLQNVDNLKDFCRLMHNDITKLKNALFHKTQQR